MDKEAKKFEAMFKEIEGLQISNLKEDLTYIQSDESSIARNDEWIKDVKTDPYIEEVLNIMRDMKN